MQAAGLQHPSELSAHHIVRRVTDTEVRLLSKLIMRMSPGALLGDLDSQHKVFKDYWPLADANSFRANSFHAKSLKAPDMASHSIIDLAL